MKKIIFPVFLMLFATLPLSAQEQSLILDSSFGIKPLSMGAEDWIVEVQPSPDGGFYVAQEELGLTKLDAEGNKLWSKPYPVVNSLAVGVYGIAVDGESNVYLGRNDYVNRASQILKYNSVGDVVASFAATGVCSLVGDVAFDDNLKTLYAVYNCPGNWGRNSILIKKFDSNLALIKSITYNSPSALYTWGAGGIALDKAGYIYVAGTSRVSFTQKVIGLKFNPDLNLAWEYGEITATSSIGSEAVPEGGLYLGWKATSFRLVNISDAGSKRWQKAVPEDYHDYKTVDKDGNFYGATWVEENDWSPTASKLGYNTGDIEWDLAEKHSAMIADIYVDSQTRVYTVGELLEPQGDANYYIARYIHGEAPRNSISKFAPPEPHLVNTGAYSAPLVSLVRDADGGAAANVNLSFSISRYPLGAGGQQLTKTSGQTDVDGLADVQLKLGNIPAEYDVKAECQSCAPEANSVTFNCCGKLPNDHFSQRDVPEWSPLPYGRHSPTETYGTIGYLGCGLTSLATLINYYSDSIYSGIPRTNPGTLNDYLLGVPNYGGYTRASDVNFTAIGRYTSGRASFVDRYDVGKYHSEESLLDMADGLIRSGFPLIFRVRHHFILVIGKCGNNYVVAEPIGGVEKLYNPADPTEREFEGLRVFGAW